MGAYRDNRSGRWRYRKWLTLPNGKRERLTGTPATDTKKAAEHAEAMHVLRVMNPNMVPEPKAKPAAPEPKEVPTIREYSKTYLEKYVPTLTKPSARRASKQILEGHVLPAFGDVRLDRIRQEHIDTFVAAEKRRGCGAKTINNRLSVLSRLLRYAIENGITAAPRIRLRCKIPSMSSEIVAVALDDVERLLAATTDERYRVAVLLATEAGLRIGEIRGLQWTDIKDGQLTVRRALDKDTGEAVAPKHNKSRAVPVSPRLERALASLPRRGLWVVGRLDGDALGYDGLLEAFGHLYDRSKVTRPPKPIHCLRHTFGTVMAGQGVPLPVLQELMGHADITTTRGYVHVNEQQKRDAISLVFGSVRQQVGNAPAEKAKAPESRRDFQCLESDPTGT